MEEGCRREIYELHRFFERWYRAECEKTDRAFSRFRDVIHEDFTYVFPDGTISGKNPLVEQLWDMHGVHNEPGNDFQIGIEDLNVLWCEDPLVLVVYKELQTEGDLTDGRISSALLRRDEHAPNELSWLHVHETWLAE